MSLRATAWAWTAQTSPTCKLVLLALADFADEAGNCWPRVSLVVEMTGLSERAVRNAITTLTDTGLLRTDRAVGRGNSSRYVLSINLDPEKVQEMQVLRGGEKVHQVPKKVQEMPEKVHHVPEKVHVVHPEPSRTVKNRQEPKSGALIAPTADLPDWLPQSAWADWCHYRRGKTWTPKAAELSIAKLDELRTAGDDPAQVINQSIANGWRGLFPLKRDRRGANPDSPSKLGWMLNP